MDPVKKYITHPHQTILLLAAGFLLIFCRTSLSAPQGEDKCFACHEAIGDKPSTGYKNDVHFAKGFSCAECHGGDATAEEQDAAMNPRKGFIGVPKKNAIIERCGRCHNDAEKMKKYRYDGPTGQADQLKQSVHGISSVTEGEMLLRCTTCHGAHGIRRVKDPASPVAPAAIVAVCAKCHSDANFMKQYDPALPVDQLQKYRTSVHGQRNAQGDANAATCASCHGSHDIKRAADATSRVNAFNVPAMCGECHSDPDRMKRYNIPVTQYEEFTKSVHGVALLKKHDAGAPSCNKCHGNHGAVPPGVSSISNVCGTCHALNSQLFSGSIHKKVFDERGLPECETCHGKHGIKPPTEEMLSVGGNTLCGKCHSSSLAPKGYRATLRMRMLLDSLRRSDSAANFAIQQAEQKGMEVTDAKFKLRDVRQSRMESRTTVHAFDIGKFEEVINKGLTITTTARDEGRAALDEYYFRRLGLGISTLVITLLVIMIYIYLKRSEKREAAARTAK